MVRLLDQLFQLVGRQVEPMQMLRVNDRQLLPRLGVERMRLQMRHIIRRRPLQVRFRRPQLPAFPQQAPNSPPLSSHYPLAVMRRKQTLHVRQAPDALRRLQRHLGLGQPLDDCSRSASRRLAVLGPAQVPVRQPVQGERHVPRRVVPAAGKTGGSWISAPGKSFNFSACNSASSI